MRRLYTSTSRGGRRDRGKQDRTEEMTEGGEGGSEVEEEERDGVGRKRG